ncbi:hypothetical protein DESC_190125 [Desulfosarcina cetonica]|nr:hypothetical protein DESC_190125 [Desulfosarcina cetonica]
MIVTHHDKTATREVLGQRHEFGAVFVAKKSVRADDRGCRKHGGKMNPPVDFQSIAHGREVYNVEDDVFHHSTWGEWVDDHRSSSTGFSVHS